MPPSTRVVACDLYAVKRACLPLITRTAQPAAPLARPFFHFVCGSWRSLPPCPPTHSRTLKSAHLNTLRLPSSSTPLSTNLFVHTNGGRSLARAQATSTQQQKPSAKCTAMIDTAASTPKQRPTHETDIKGDAHTHRANRKWGVRRTIRTCDDICSVSVVISSLLH